MLSKPIQRGKKKQNERMPICFLRSPCKHLSTPRLHSRCPLRQTDAFIRSSRSKAKNRRKKLTGTRPWTGELSRKRGPTSRSRSSGRSPSRRQRWPRRAAAAAAWLGPSPRRPRKRRAPRHASRRREPWRRVWGGVERKGREEKAFRGRGRGKAKSCGGERVARPKKRREKKLDGGGARPSPSPSPRGGPFSPPTLSLSLPSSHLMSLSFR